MEAAMQPGDSSRLELCSNCDVAAAVAWCLDCKGSLCEKCELAHRRVSLTRNHRVHNQPTQAQTLSPSKPCDRHPSELLELICFTCKTLTCRDCQLTTHKNHSYQFVSESITKLKETMSAAIQPIRAQVDTVSQSLKDMETRLRFIEKSKDHLKTDLLHFFTMLGQSLQKKMKDIYTEIVMNCALERERIHSRMKTLEDLQKNHTEILELSKKCQSSTEFLTVFMQWKKIKQQISIVQGQDLSPPSTMAHFFVWTQKEAIGMIEKMVFLEADWIPFAVPQEHVIKDSRTPSEAVTNSSPSKIRTSSSRSTSSLHLKWHFYQPNKSTPSNRPKQQTTKDSAIIVGEADNVVTDSALESSTTTQANALNNSLPSESLSSVVFQPDPLVETGGPKTNPSLSNNLSNNPMSAKSYPSFSHSISAIHASLSKHFPTHIKSTPQAVTTPAVSDSSNTTASRMKTPFPQPVNPNHKPNSTSSLNSITSTNGTTTARTTTATLSKEERFPIISSLLGGSDTSGPRLPSPNTLQASGGCSANIIQAPLAPNQSVQVTTMPSQFIALAPVAASLNVLKPPSHPTSKNANNSRAPIQNPVPAQNLTCPLRDPFQNVFQAPMLPQPNFVQDTSDFIPSVPPRCSTLNVVQDLIIPSPTTVNVPQLASSDVIQAFSYPPPNYAEAVTSQRLGLMANVVPQPPQAQTSAVSCSDFDTASPDSNIALGANLIQPLTVTCQQFTPPLMNSCPVFAGAAGLPMPNVQTSSFNGVQGPTGVHSPNVSQAPTVSSSKVILAPSHVSVGTVMVSNQTLLEANTIPYSNIAPTSGLLLTPTDVPANTSSVRAMSASPGPLTGSCAVPVLSQTQLLANSAAPPDNDQATHIPTHAKILNPPAVAQFAAASVYSSCNNNNSVCDLRGDAALETVEPVSLGNQAKGCNLHQAENADNEPTTTVSEEPEPNTRGFTAKVMPEPATADNEPSSTVPEDPESDKNEQIVTSTSDIRVDKLSSLETSEPDPVYAHQDIKINRLTPRVSLLRIPVHRKPGRPLPRFRVVVGKSNDQIYLKEMEESKAWHSPLDNSFPDFVDLTLSPEGKDQRCVIMDPITNRPIEDGVDVGEPLLIPDSPISLEILSCSVCMSSESLIICSVCARGYHKNCHIPEVNSHAMSNWNCSLCREASEPLGCETPETPEDGLSPQDQRRCETLLLFLKVEACKLGSEFADRSHLKLLTKRLAGTHPSPYRSVAHFITDVGALFVNTSQDEASDGLRTRVQGKLEQMFGSEVVASSLSEGSEAGEKADRSKHRMKLLKRKLKHFLNLQTVKKAKME